MLFERQRVLLSLLDALNEPIGSTDFQKLLFLFTREHEQSPSYEFVPYRFGCLSFTSYADKRKLIEQGLLEEDDQCWRLTDEGRRLARKKNPAPLLFARFCRHYGGIRGNNLIADVYRRFPYYAIHSEIADKILITPEAKAAVEAARPEKSKPALVTIGYEGKSLEAYLNQLLRESVTLLCDVRRNPLSRKYGFSKGTLSHACQGVGIRYEHLPELGIPSDQRKELLVQADYDALFADYEQNDLPKQQASLARIQRWIEIEGERVALTCFELKHQQCHRHCVAEALSSRWENRYELRHLEETCLVNEYSLP